MQSAYPSFVLFTAISTCATQLLPSAISLLCATSPSLVSAMKLFHLLALFVVLLPSAVLSQYSCPLIHYTQSIEPVSTSLFPSSPAYKLSFVNQSPNLPLAFLDVHYAVNNADTNNVRLVSTSATASPPVVPPFLLGDDDQLDYWFTYGVKALGLACDTHHFQVTGREVKQHAMSKHEDHTADVKTEDKAKDTAIKETTITKETHTAAVSAPVTFAAPTPGDVAKSDTTGSTVDSRTLPALHEINPTLVIPPLGLTEPITPATTPTPATAASTMAVMDHIEPAVDRSAEPLLDTNPGVCPLISFTQQLTRASSSSANNNPNLYTLKFQNNSPVDAVVPLAFLDVHFTINGGPTANLRLFSDRESSGGSSGSGSGSGGMGGVSNEVRGLEGIVKMEGDQIEYSYTYGVKEASVKDGKVRACNTEVYRVKIDNNIK